MSMNNRNEHTIEEKWHYIIERDGSLQLHRERWYYAEGRNGARVRYCDAGRDARLGRTSWYMRVTRGIWVACEDEEPRVTEDVIFRTATELRSVVTHVVGAGHEPQ
jgi:hypothetical protein